MIIINLLVSGAGGFIGFHVAIFFSTRGYNVIGIDNLSRGILLGDTKNKYDRNWNFLEKNYPKIELYQIDIRDEENIKKLFSKYKFEIIIHTAGQTAIKQSIENPHIDMNNNFLGTFILLEAARYHCKNPIFLYCSTNKVFGENPNQIHIIEDDFRYKYDNIHYLGINETFSIDQTKHTPYGMSKLAADLYIQEYAMTYGFRAGIFRMSCIYGPNQLSFEDQGWVAHIIKQVLLGNEIKVYGDGKQVRDILYIDDLIDVYDRFIMNQKIGSQVFCVGGGKDNSISILELLKILEKELKKSINFRIFPWRQADQKIYISDITKARDLLNWKPKITIQEGIKRTIESIQKM